MAVIPGVIVFPPVPIVLIGGAMAIIFAMAVLLLCRGSVVFGRCWLASGKHKPGSDATAKTDK
jgi:hypothetical protein